MAKPARAAIPLDMLSKPIATNPSAPAPQVSAAPQPEPVQPEPVVEPVSPAPVVAAPAESAALEPQVVNVFAAPELAETIRPVVINAPVHPRSAKMESSSLSVKVDAARYQRVAMAKAKTGLLTQQILSEALDIWLAHNGF